MHVQPAPLSAPIRTHILCILVTIAIFVVIPYKLKMAAVVFDIQFLIPSTSFKMYTFPISRSIGLGLLVP